MSKFISKTILTSKDGLEFEEVIRDQPIKIDEKKLTFMTLNEQIVAQDKMDQQTRPEVTKMVKKKQTKPNIYEKTKPLSDEEYVEESGFKQEIFNEEDFDYFQYYGHLREIEDKKQKLEREHIKQFKQRRGQLIIENNPLIVVYKDSNTNQGIRQQISAIKPKRNYEFLEDNIVGSQVQDQNKRKSLLYDDDDEDEEVKKQSNVVKKVQLVAYDSD